MVPIPCQADLILILYCYELHKGSPRPVRESSPFSAMVIRWLTWSNCPHEQDRGRRPQASSGDHAPQLGRSGASRWIWSIPGFRKNRLSLTFFSNSPVVKMILWDASKLLRLFTAARETRVSRQMA